MNHLQIKAFLLQSFKFLSKSITYSRTVRLTYTPEGIKRADLHNHHF